MKTITDGREVLVVPTAEENARSPSRPTHSVQIRSGLYEGVSHRLDEGRYVIGSGETADIVLMEQDIAPHHVVIVLHGAKITIESLTEGVRVAGYGKIVPKVPRTVRLPAAISIGDVHTIWNVANEAEHPSESVTWPAGVTRWLEGRVVPSAAAAALLVVGGIFIHPWRLADAAVVTDTTAKPGMSPEIPAQRPASGTALPAGVAREISEVGSIRADLALDRTRSPRARSEMSESIAVAAADLQGQVQAAGLHDVQVEVVGNAVTASGSIDPSMVNRWESLQQEFDARFQGEVHLFNKIVARVEKRPNIPNIEGVWRGVRPYVVLRGQRYFIGAVLEDGWAIQGIESNRILLERHGRIVAMRF